MRVPVLTYHAVNVASGDYAGNDHVALAEDLRLIQRLGLRVLPLARVVDVLLGESAEDLSRTVALSCDDGSDLDVCDLDWPGVGPQRGFLNILADFAAEHGAAAQPGLHLTAFVIASPEARTRLDQRALHGLGWMNEDWWPRAQASGRMAIENHSLDHNHPLLDGPGPDGMPRGDFYAVDNPTRARAEIAEAARYIDARIAPVRTSLFCYPFGHAPDYLRHEYLPRFQAEHGMRAAFGVEAAPVTAASDRWHLPRYVCGFHWKAPGELEAILRDTALA
jgi:hypothetical protein